METESIFCKAVILADLIIISAYLVVLIYASIVDEYRRYIHVIKALVIIYMATLAAHVALGLEPSYVMVKPFRVMFGTLIFLEALSLYVEIRIKNR